MEQILSPVPPSEPPPLVLADEEPYTEAIFDQMRPSPFDPRVPWLYGFKLDFRFK